MWESNKSPPRDKLRSNGIRGNCNLFESIMQTGQHFAYKHDHMYKTLTCAEARGGTRCHPTSSPSLREPTTPCVSVSITSNKYTKASIKKKSTF